LIGLYFFRSCGVRWSHFRGPRGGHHDRKARRWGEPASSRSRLPRVLSGLDQRLRVAIMRAAMFRVLSGRV